MEHVAIDLGSRQSQVCRRRSDGTIVEERKVGTTQLSGYLKRVPAPARVIVETCAEAFGVADRALTLGHEVRVVPATLAKALGVGARGIKTDTRDARALSEASCRLELPTVHVPSAEARERRVMCGMRETLVAARTALVNTVRSWLRADAVVLARGAPESLPARVRRWALLNTRELPACVERVLVMIEQVSVQLAAADRELRAAAEADAVCARLMSVPGVGPVTALLYRAVLDDAQRFSGAHAVESYLGLTPGERSSSQTTRRTGITKAGSPRMRYLLVQGAHTARRCRPRDPMVLWSRQVEARRGKHAAVVALARKLAGILFAIWRHGGRYEASRGAVSSACTPAAYPAAPLQ